MGPGGPMGMGNRGMMGPGPGGRMPGPPPPYPAGRGGPGASPNPHSPATSLPMSSPGAGMINSPRPMGSNPGTPVSGPPLSSPVLGKNSPGGGSSAQHGMPGGQGKAPLSPIFSALIADLSALRISPLLSLL